MASIGIEWVKQYHGRAANLTNTRAQAEAFYNSLSGTRSFNWGDDLAWDQDFEQSGTGSPGSGTDTTWVDNVEIVFFSGHGSPSGAMFGIANRDDGTARPTQVRWGNKNLEWIAFDACNMLDNNGVFPRWVPAFQGLHLILGFHTTTGDEAQRGGYFADYLNSGYTVREAWIKACQETEGSDTEWAYLRADAPGTDTYHDHWHGKGFVSADPVNPTNFFYARGQC